MENITKQKVQISHQICTVPYQSICLKVFEEGFGEELFEKSSSPHIFIFSYPSRCSHRNSANFITGISVATDTSEVDPTSSAAHPGEMPYISPNIVMTAAVGIAAMTQPKTTI